MKEFGQSFYESYVYFNFDEEDELRSIFEVNKNPQRIIELLSLIAGEKILPGKTLVIFDEVQECPEALNALKYFKEKANGYHIVAAGSLPGTLLAQPKSCPVDMVNLLNLYPLYFDEFLEAIDPALFAYYESIQKNQIIEELFHNRLLEAYNSYLIIGGMPECVSSWVNHKDPAAISQIQRELVEIYENDFSKHNGKVNSGRILMVFRSIVSQLAKSNEKFIYGAVRQGGRARNFEEAIEWLVSAGMLNRIYNVSKMEHPLSAFDKLDQFKLFLFDTGLLKHKTDAIFRVENMDCSHEHGALHLSSFKPYAKNQPISKVFREIGLADELGSGMPNTYKYTKLYSGGTPEFIEGEMTIPDKPRSRNQKYVAVQKSTTEN